MTSLIELKNVTKRYGGINALESVSLHVRKGEIFTTLGPNGSGKTTLLRIMALIDSPTDGSMFFQGHRINDRNRTRVRKKCTMVFQKTALFSTTVRKNVAYGLKLRGYTSTEIRQRVKQALSLVKLQGYEERRAKQLSGGEQQRVSLARALTLNTELLLLDEPTANLDPKSMSIIEEAILRINRELNATVVMATHNIFQAETITERVALLLEGRIARIGSPHSVLRSSSTDLAGFARLENVFSGISTVTREGTSVIAIERDMRIESTLKESGRVTVFVSPEDIIVSKKSMPSSARNVFKGKVVNVSDLGSVVKLRVDVGREFVVQITKRSFVDMKLNVDSVVFLNFKASSVNQV